jgi:competence protein ComEC
MSLQDDVFSRAANMRGRPAVCVVLFFIAGILFSHIFPVPLKVLPYLFGIITILILSSVLWFKRTQSGIIIALLFILLGYTKYTIEYNYSRNVSAEIFGEPSRNILAWGTIVDRPRIREDRAQFIVRTDSLNDGIRSLYTTSDLLVIASPDMRYDRGLIQIEYGDYVLVHGYITLPAGRRNPYEPDFSRNLSLNGIDALLYVRGYHNIETSGTGNASYLMTAFINPLRNYISGVIDRNISGESAHFLRGLMLGDRSRISEEVREHFVSAGVIHVLAVSGLHVGIVTVIIFSVLGFLRIPRIPKILLTIAGLMIFMYMTGAAPSVIRATVMASIILLGIVLQRKSDIYNSVAVAALVLLMYDTRDLFKPSFQFSFVAVLAIVYLYPRFSGGMMRRFPRLEERWLLRYAVQLFLVSCAAQIGTLPFTAFYFERVSLAAFGANLLVIPCVFFVLSFGFAAVVVGTLNPLLERIYGYTSDFLLTGMLRFIEFVSQFSYASIEVYNFNVIDGLIFFAVTAVIVHITNPRRFRLSVLVLMMVLNIYIIDYNINFDADRRQAILSITMLDVGQGDALFIEFPDGKTMLYDSGPRTIRSDAGERIVVPFLKRHGIRHIDAVVISHPHADHYGGLEAVLDEVSVGTVYDTGQSGSGQWYAALHKKIGLEKIPVTLVRGGDFIDGFDNVRIYVVHPAPPFVQKPEDDRSWNLNNASIVLLIIYGDTRILLTGDAEREAEHYMIYIYDDFLRADILKAGHHGSRTSNTDGFLSMVAPETAIISVGRLNRFNHPSEEVIRRFEENDIAVYRTDRNGAVVVRTCGREYRIATMR